MPEGTFYYHELERDSQDYNKYSMRHREVPVANAVNTAEVAEAHHREAHHREAD